jgi:N-acetylglutamate synthase-like GNAT family acetyltransferase
VHGLLARENGVLHLMCLSTNAPFYERFGFRRIEHEEMPPYFRRMARIANLFGLLVPDERRLVVMRREPTGA